MDLQHLRASDGTGEAVLAHIQTVRNPGSTVLDLDNVDNWNSKAVIITGTPAANGFVSPIGMKVMYGHLSAGDFIIDGYAPGYADNGNTTAEVAIVKMTTSWADTLISLLGNSLSDSGFLKVTSLDHFYKPGEITPDSFISSGGVVAVSAGLITTMSNIVYYIAGLRYTKTAIANRTWGASKDGYVDIDAAGTLTYTEVANGAASPALVAGRVRIAVVITGGAAVSTIQQIGSFDSLGNKVYPRGSVSDSNAPDLFWQEAGRATLTALTTSTTFFIKPYKYLCFLITVNCTGNNQVALRFNADTANNYSDAYSLWDGNAYGADVNQNFCPIYGLGAANNNKISARGFMDNPASGSKVGKIASMKHTGSAANAPVPEELWVQWVNIVDKINKITMFDRTGINLGVGSEIIVLGHN